MFKSSTSYTLTCCIEVFRSRHNPYDVFCLFQYCIEENSDKLTTTQAKVVACLKDQKDSLKDLQVDLHISKQIHCNAPVPKFQELASLHNIDSHVVYP